MTNNEVAIAFGAFFIERNVGNPLALVEAPRSLAVRISGAGHKLAEAPALQHHHTAAVLAILFLGGFLHFSGIQVRKIDRVFLGEGAAVGILFVVRAARVKRPVLAPLDDQRRTAALALFVGGLLHTLDVLHVLGGVLEVLLEFLIEIGERLGPGFLAFFDFVEFFFEARGVLNVEDVGEVLYKQIGYHQPDLGGNEFSAGFLRVHAFLNRGEDGGVGRRAADSALFQFFDERGFVVARRRLGKVLLRLQFP